MGSHFSGRFPFKCMWLYDLTCLLCMFITFFHLALSKSAVLVNLRRGTPTFSVFRLGRFCQVSGMYNSCRFLVGLVFVLFAFISVFIGLHLFFIFFFFFRFFHFFRFFPLWFLFRFLDRIDPFVVSLFGFLLENHSHFPVDDACSVACVSLLFPLTL